MEHILYVHQAYDSRASAIRSVLRDGLQHNVSDPAGKIAYESPLYAGPFYAPDAGISTAVRRTTSLDSVRKY